MEQNTNFLKYDLSQLSLLIVDNSQKRRDLVRSMLDALNIEQVVEAENASAAIRQLNESESYLVIAELTMTPATGLDLVREIRTSKYIPNPVIPIIMLSVKRTLESVCEARDAGIDEFVARPFALKVLYDRIVTSARSPRPIIVSNPYFGPDRRRQTRWHNDFGDSRRRPGWTVSRR